MIFIGDTCLVEKNHLLQCVTADIVKNWFLLLGHLDYDTHLQTSK